MIKVEDGKVVFKPKEKLFYQIFEKKLDNERIYYKLSDFQTQITIKLPQASVSVEEAQDLNKNLVDSTGIKLWPAEEIMAYYVSKNIENFKSKRVIELGAGYSGLASIVLAAYMIKAGLQIDLTITDGLDICAERIKENIIENPVLKGHFDIQYENEELSKATSERLGKIHAKKLVWAFDIKTEEKFDIILLSDCLFFKKFHNELEATLFELLNDNPDSYCLFANPMRGDSTKLFFELAQKRFVVSELERDDFLNTEIEKLKSQQDYNADTDDIKLYKVTKKLS